MTSNDRLANGPGRGSIRAVVLALLILPALNPLECRQQTTRARAALTKGRKRAA